MRKKLAAESEAPLRLPLLYGAAVLFGKGSTDSIFTVLKSVAGVTKEPLGEHATMFAVDSVCMVAGMVQAVVFLMLVTVLLERKKHILLCPASSCSCSFHALLDACRHCPGAAGIRDVAGLPLQPKYMVAE